MPAASAHHIISLPDLRVLFGLARSALGERSVFRSSTTVSARMRVSSAPWQLRMRRRRCRNGQVHAATVPTCSGDAEYSWLFQRAWGC